MAAADHHRLGGLSGLLDGTWLGGRGDQTAARPDQEPDPLYPGGRRLVPVLFGRLAALHGARDLDGGPGGAGLGHRPCVRRMHALPRRPGLHGPLDGANPQVARPLHGLALAEWFRRAGGVRDRAGRGVRGPSRRIRGPGGAGAPRRNRRRWLARTGEGADAGGGGRWGSLYGGGLTSALPTFSASEMWTTFCTRWAQASTCSTVPRPPAWH